MLEPISDPWRHIDVFSFGEKVIFRDKVYTYVRPALFSGWVILDLSSDPWVIRQYMVKSQDIKKLK